ncbi:MAG: hypothetical protein JW995_04135 [Melioribacteraceae bacterium]|nr:hypothetical protein [Melioribacteraceae bacterium]
MMNVLIRIGISVMLLAAFGCQADNDSTKSNTSFSPEYSSVMIDTVMQLKIYSEFIKPQFDSSGKFLLLTKDGYEGLYLYNLQDKKLKQITDGMGAGFHNCIAGENIYFVYNDYISGMGRFYDLIRYDIVTGDSEKIYSSKRKIYSLMNHHSGYVSFFTRDSMYVIDLESKELIDNKLADVTRYLISENMLVKHSRGNQERIKVADDKNIISINYYCSDTLLVEIAGDGLFKYSLSSGSKSLVGNYKNAVYTRATDCYAYIVPEDDGYRVMKSELYITNPEKQINIKISSDSNALEENPCWSMNGKMLAYNTFDGQIMLAHLSYR